ncbi:MAG: S8 family serine peptidase [Proteobacteria bacterium]|nr:S8 family serine peptidase [Pseudomonadota bacterium]
MHSSQIRPLIFLLFICLGSQSSLAVEQISFRNYSKKIELQKVGDHQYQITNSQFKVRLTNRIIVKVGRDIREGYLLSLSSSIREVVLLYKMDSFVYYSLELDRFSSLPTTMEVLKSNADIRLVQPDILQQTTRSRKSRSRQGSNAWYLSEIKKLWRTTRGKGVRIAVIDDGFDLEHEDLAGVKLLFGYDLNSKTLDSSPKNLIDNHGTKVLGIIFARHNQIGIDGIAPEADLIAIRHVDTWTSKTMLSFYLSKLANADVINCSWQSSFLLEPINDIINDLAEKGRDGKGLPIVFAAGNGSGKITPQGSEAAIENVITVGSSGRDGRKLKFSNYGKYIDVYAPGRNIITTNRSLKKKYIAFSGTSASASIVTGLIALLISQKPDITLDQINSGLNTFF